MLQFVCFVIGAMFGGCFAATVMALIFAHTDLYVKDGDDNNEEKSPQGGVKDKCQCGLTCKV